MANFCYPAVTDAITSIELRLPEVVQLGLFGGGPGGELLDIVVTGPPILRVTFPAELQSFPVNNLRVFEVMGVGAGRTTLEARIPASGISPSAVLQVSVGGGSGAPTDSLSHYYHGTKLADAKKLITIDLVPFAVMTPLLLDINEYTDFGKGFYTHPEESKFKALEWAKRRSQQKNTDWGIARFALTTPEEDAITGQTLYFPDKFRTRPANAPKLFNSQPATWIEFVEFNRHVRTPSIQRPKDNDWTTDYAWMRGPIWGRHDSKLPGAPGLPEMYKQINWGASGMGALNTTIAKQRRFLFTKHNEGSL
jgi:hypothetical protein